MEQQQLSHALAQTTPASAIPTAGLNVNNQQPSTAQGPTVTASTTTGGSVTKATATNDGPPPLNSSIPLHSSSANSEEDEHTVVATDPSGRFERFKKCLGIGAYKKVYLAFDQEEGVEVAWNELRIDHLQSQDVNKVLSEVKILQSLRHDSIINLYHCWTGRENQREQVYFITELMTSGTLKSYIRKAKGTLKSKVIKNWSRQILKGLEYLHSRDPPIIHRDLKAKIGDLGLAIVKQRDFVSSVLGTPEFMAPELYDEKYDEKVDVYAFGMCVLEMVTKEYPYNECSNQAQIFRKVTSNIKPAVLESVTDPQIKSFIELCIEFDPEKRPAAADLLKHPFLAPETTSTGIMNTMESPSTISAGVNTGADSSTEMSSSNGSGIATAQQSMGSSDAVLQAVPNNSENIQSTISSVQITSIEYPIIMVKMVCTSANEFEYPQEGSTTRHPKKQEVKFPYHVKDDTVEQVVDEMVKEGVLLARERDHAVKRIHETIIRVLDPLSSIFNKPFDASIDKKPSRSRSFSAGSRRKSLDGVRLHVIRSPGIMGRSLSFSSSRRLQGSPLFSGNLTPRKLSHAFENSLSDIPKDGFSSAQVDRNFSISNEPVVNIEAPPAIKIVNQQQAQPMSHYQKSLEEKTNEIIEGVYISQFRRGTSASSTSSSNIEKNSSPEEMPVISESEIAKRPVLDEIVTSRHRAKEESSSRPLSLSSEISETSVYVSDVGSTIRSTVTSEMSVNTIRSLFQANGSNSMSSPATNAGSTLNRGGLSAEAQRQLEELQHLALSGFEKSAQQQHQNSTSIPIPSSAAIFNASSAFGGGANLTLKDFSKSSGGGRLPTAPTIAHSLPTSPIVAPSLPHPADRRMSENSKETLDPFTIALESRSRSGSAGSSHARSASLALGSSVQMHQQVLQSLSAPENQTRIDELTKIIVEEQFLEDQKQQLSTQPPSASINEEISDLTADHDKNLFRNESI